MTKFDDLLLKISVAKSSPSPNNSSSLSVQVTCNGSYLHDNLNGSQRTIGPFTLVLCCKIDLVGNDLFLVKEFILNPNFGPNRIEQMLCD